MKFQVLKPRPRTPALLNLQRRVVYTLFSIYTHYGEEAMYEVLDHAAESLPRRDDQPVQCQHCSTWTNRLSGCCHLHEAHLEEEQ